MNEPENNEIEQQTCEMTSLRFSQESLNPAATKGNLTTNDSLPLASSRGDLNTVSTYVDSGLDINTTDKSGNSALTLSCYHGHIDVVKYLLEKGASLIQLGNLTQAGQTPLHASVLGGHTEIVDTLLQQKNVDANATDETKNTALHLACQQECIQMVQTLLRHGADIEIKNRLGRTPLFVAVSRHSLNIVHILAEGKATEITTTDTKGESLLHLALDTDIITFLAEKGIPVDCRDKRGHTPLMTAVILSQPEKVRTLLALGADPNIPDFNCNYPIHHAVDIGNSDIVDLLLSSNLSIEVRDQTGETPLHHAAIKLRIDIMKQLLNKGANINAQDSLGYNPLYHFCGSLPNEEIELLKEFIKLGCDVNLPDNAGITPLMHACEILPVEMVQALIDAGSDIHRTDIQGWTALFYCTQEPDKFELLISRGAQVDHADTDKWTVLHHCTYFDNADSVKIVLQMFKKADKNGLEYADRNGSTALHIAAAYGAIFAMEVLLQFGSVINVRDIHGNTPLHFAAFRHQTEAFSRLVDAGADVNAKDNIGETPFQVAAKVRCYSILELQGKNSKCHWEIIEPVQNRFLSTSHSKSNETPMHASDRFITNEELANLLYEDKHKKVMKTGVEHLENLKTAFGLGEVEFKDEAYEIQQTVKGLAQHLSNKISEIDPRFKTTIVFAGSAQEKTKVGFPDEFDVMFVLDRLSELCREPSGQDRKNGLFVRLRPRQDICFDEYKEFVVDGFVSRKRVFHAFGNLLKSVSSSITLPSNLFPNMSLATATGMIFPGTTCVQYYMWRGSEYKLMDLDVDMVPAIHFKGWPSFLCPVAPLGEHIKKNGYHLVTKEFEPEGTMYESQAETLWCLSFTSAEQAIMNSLSDDMKDVYRMAKTLRSWEFSPDVRINVPLMMYLNAEIIIPSYFLKIALFNLITEWNKNKETLGESEPYADDHGHSTDKTETTTGTCLHRCSMDEREPTQKLDVSSLYSSLANAFASQNLPYFFSSDHNLLYKVSKKSEDKRQVDVNVCRMLSEIASM